MCKRLYRGVCLVEENELFLLLLPLNFMCLPNQFPLLQVLFPLCLMMTLLPIDVRKGTRSCTKHPITNYMCYDILSPEFRAFPLLYCLFPFHAMYLKLYPNLNGEEQWRRKCMPYKREKEKENS